MCRQRYRVTHSLSSGSDTVLTDSPTPHQWDMRIQAMGVVDDSCAPKPSQALSFLTSGPRGRAECWKSAVDWFLCGRV